MHSRDSPIDLSFLSARGQHREYGANQSSQEAFESSLLFFDAPMPIFYLLQRRSEESECLGIYRGEWLLVFFLVCSGFELLRRVVMHC